MPRIPVQNTRFIDPQAERARGMSALEAIRGYAGAPSQASVMRPGEAEAYGAGELTGLAEAALPFAALGKGALGAALAGVIKPRGGNWLPDSVEKALQPVRFNEFRGMSLPETVALNRWIEGPLTKYIKREMATPEDPVRRLAEQGILHYTPGQEFIVPDSELVRLTAGYPEEGMGVSELARKWENVADEAIVPNKVGSLRREGVLPEENWANKLSAEDTLYSIASHAENETGIWHLTDELFNALNPESGLPQNLLLRPEQLQQMGMEKAVRHVHDINQWRAAQNVAADLEIANKAMTVREYPDTPEFPNPKGLRWVELKAPSDFDTSKPPPPDTEWVDTAEGPMLEHLDSGERFHPGYMDLEKQLKYEGDTMGHCVGGYCSDVISGQSRIFSLRDAKGQPHVTVELNPEDGAYKIAQIKGKQNKKPIKEYTPFVQDFVRNAPLEMKWGTVQDLQNTDLIDLPSYYGKKLPDDVPRFMTRAEEEAFSKSRPDIKSVWDEVMDGSINIGGFEPEMAEGGAVRTPANWRKLELGGTIGYLMGE